jgi:hypothetical protein
MKLPIRAARQGGRARRSGGYQIIFKNAKWSQVHGSAATARRLKREDRRGHRSETRKAGKLERTSEAEIKRAIRRAR